MVYVGLLVMTYFEFKRAPTGFIPQQDQGRLIVNIQLPDSASLQRTIDTTAEVNRLARETPGVAHTVAFAGMSFLLQAASSNYASMFVVLDAFDKRQSPELTDVAIMAKMRRAWAKAVPEAKVTVFGASPIPGLGTAGGFKVMVEDRGGLGIDALQTQTDALVRKLREYPALASTATQFRSNTPQLWLDIDRTKAAALGVTFDDVNQTLSMFLGSLYVNSYNEFGRHWQVTVQADGTFRDRDNAISLFQVRNAQGQMVPLGTLITPKDIGGPVSMTRLASTPPRQSMAISRREPVRETRSLSSIRSPEKPCRFRPRRNGLTSCSCKSKRAIQPFTFFSWLSSACFWP